MFLLLAGIVGFGCRANAHQTRDASRPEATHETGYDSLLASQLRADAYGMGRYVVAFLKADPNRSKDSVAAAELRRAHLDNIQRLAEERKLVLAGPSIDGGDVRGIYVIDVATVRVRP